MNFFFANSGIRQIVTLDNACGTYKNGSIEYFLQKLVLGEFANTAKCPIKPVNFQLFQHEKRTNLLKIKF